MDWRLHRRLGRRLTRGLSRRLGRRLTRRLSCRSLKCVGRQLREILARYNLLYHRIMSTEKMHVRGAINSTSVHLIEMINHRRTTQQNSAEGVQAID